jgi:hypothetical protein
MAATNDRKVKEACLREALRQEVHDREQEHHAATARFSTQLYILDLLHIASYYTITASTKAHSLPVKERILPPQARRMHTGAALHDSRTAQDKIRFVGCHAQTLQAKGKKANRREASTF